VDRNLALELVRVTEAAALASARYFGKGDPVMADRAAIEAMELAIKGVKITGRIIIGEELNDKNSKLCAGSMIGAGGEPEVDVAIDPLDCIDCLASGLPNAISAIALGERGSFKDSRTPYTRKIVVSSDAAEFIDLTKSTFENLVAIAQAKRVYVEDLTISILNRPWNEKLIGEVREAGARIELIQDGELAASIAAALPGTGVDAVMGIGYSKQTIIAAAAVACISGGLQAQYVPEPDVELEALNGKYSKVYSIDDLVGGRNIMFAATGVSRSDFLQGVIFRPGGAITNSVVFRRKSGTIRFLRTEHFFDKTPDYT